jgi:hypothetical protein
MKMVEFKASFNNQWPLDWLNTSKHNKGMDINNNLKNVSCQRKRHSCNHPNKNLFVTTKSNCNASKNGYFFIQICKRENNLLEHTKLIEINFKNYKIYISCYNNISY